MMINVDNRLLEIIKEQTGSDITFQQVKDANAIRKQERLLKKGMYVSAVGGVKVFLPGSLCGKLLDAGLLDEVRSFARANPEDVSDYVKALNL